MDAATKLPLLVVMINATLRQIAPSGETVRATVLAARPVLHNKAVGGEYAIDLDALKLVDRIDALLGQPVTSTEEVRTLLRDIRAALGFK